MDISKVFEKIKGNKKVLIFSIIIGIIIFIGLIISTIFALLNINNPNFIKGVYINDIDVSGVSMSEAKSKIEALTNEKLAKEISISSGDYNTTINASILEVNYDINSAIEEAYSVGRNKNLIANNYEILQAMLFDKKIDININLNQEILDSTINDMASKLPDAMTQSSYYIEDDNLVITKGKRGSVINGEEFSNDLRNIFSDLRSTESDIEIPIDQKEPDAIDIEKIHDEVYKEEKDAYYNEEPFEIYPEVNGIDFDVDEVKKLLETDQEEYIIKLTITKPKVTINDLSAIAFKDVLATFSTRYDVSNVDRTTNLKLATKKINGTILGAGEEFSYNRIVGERTIAAGYKEAKVYSNGEVVDGIGGGICQISSTIYNAAVLANLDITQRRNHQFVTSYVPAGRDATVVYGSQDFRFKNTRKYPVKIEVTVNNGVAKATIYGIKEKPEYEVSIQTRTVSTIPFTTTYKEDSSMAVGEERVQKKGVNGLVTEAYKVVTSNGSVVSKTLLSKDVYNAMAQIIVRGTGNAEEPAQTPDPAPVSNNVAKPESSSQAPVNPTEIEEETVQEPTSDLTDGEL